MEPSVEKNDFETGANCWCYFCAKEVEKHELYDGVTIKNGSFLQHLTSPGHLEKTHIFWLEHKLDKNIKDRYLLTEDDILQFRQKLLPAVQNFKKRLQDKIKQSSVRIQMQEMKQLATVELQGKIQESQLENANKKSNVYARGVPVKTVKDPASFLTHIPLQNDGDEEEGNIHTGATPSWIIDNDETAEVLLTEIGPSLQDFQKHLDQVKESKLPSTRVCAKFDHKQPTDSSFGREWSHNKREHARKQFMSNSTSRSTGRGSAALGRPRSSYLSAGVRSRNEEQNDINLPYPKRIKQEYEAKDTISNANSVTQCKAPTQYKPYTNFNRQFSSSAEDAGTSHFVLSGNTSNYHNNMNCPKKQNPANSSLSFSRIKIADNLLKSNKPK